MCVAVGGDLAGLHHDHAQALEQHDHLDEVRGAEARAGEPGEPLGNPRVVELTDDDQGDDADNGADAQELIE